MKRILLLATVAALMAVVVSASAAFAHESVCPPSFTPFTASPGTSAADADRDGDGLVCWRILGLGEAENRYSDDHDHAT